MKYFIATSFLLLHAFTFMPHAFAKEASHAALTTSQEPSAINSIKHVMLSTWDRPETKLNINPVVIEGQYAIAGWTQGERGGRALLIRKPDGHWFVSVCGGDGLKEEKTLIMTGMEPVVARRLTNKVIRAESSLTPELRVQLASFEGIVKVNAPGKH
ncbi:copper uptake system-associated protein [Comamonas squillarum]|uniref:Copper uptake system-associated protein n=1 Tax=Comamonas squillarum TaxID=2977320 RepID=A0ABY6A2I3_9BURK|nr:copper uptake system-associated protein [Comamonas sp. PR12]UXC20498.1 copper uptake system-associated protein [Comamonas sp. PR12]